MKKTLLLASFMALATAVSAANATNLEHAFNPLDHATRTEVKAADKKLQDQITQHGYEINTQAKYTTSVNQDLQAAKASQGSVNQSVQGQIGAVNDKVDSYAQQGAAAYNQIQGQISQTNQSVSDVDGKLNAAIGTQTGINTATQTQLNAVQNAAQIANEKGDAGAVRMDGIESQAKVTDDRSINNAVRLDGVEGAVRDTNTKVDGAIATQTGVNGKVQDQIADVNGKAVNAQNTADVAVGLGQKGINDAYNAQKTADFAVGQGQKNANDIVNTNNNLNSAVKTQQGVNANQNVINSNQSVINSKQTVVNNNQTTTNQNVQTQITTTNTSVTKVSNDLKTTNTVVGQHTQQITNLDSRTTATESVNVRQDVQLGQHSEALAQYGQRIANQEDISAALNQSFSSYKAASGQRMDAMQRQIDNVDRKAEKAQNMAVGALAVAGLQFDTNQDAGFQVAGGVATMGGKQAMAFGAGGAVSKKVFVSAAVTQASGVSGGTVSATYSFGR